jgi:D-alanyl-D-alanine carboxypeptidase
MFMLLSALLAAGLTGSNDAAPCADSLASRLSAQIAPELASTAAAGRFSGVILITCKGKPLYSATYGLANRAKGRRNTLDTKFNLGSMNKMWTAIAVAQLVEQKRLDLNAPVGKYLPELSNAALRDRVLVKHLLNHTSGLGSYFTPAYMENRTPIKSPFDLLPYFVKDSLSFAPGARFQYSNAGFAVLGMLIERVSGVNYYTYMKRNILDRAGMTGAAFITLPSTDAKVAMGYATPPGRSDTVENVDLVERRSTPAGGAFATAPDLVAFAQALWSGKLVSRAMADQFTTGTVKMGGSMSYAYGFGEATANGWREVGHNGGAPGVSTDFKSFPAEGIEIVVLSNIEAPAADEVMSLAVSALTGAPRRRMLPPPGAAGGPPRGATTTAPSALPNTPIGRRAAGFLKAFGGGSPAMAAFIAEEMVQTDVTPMERAKRGEPMRADIGTLTLKRVISASETLIVLAVDGSNVGPLELTLESEPTAPYRLLPSVSIIRRP